MVLNNYWKFLVATSNRHYVPGSNTVITSGCVDLSGNTNVQIRNGSAGTAPGYGVNFNTREGIRPRIGNGTTDPDLDDYCLSHDITDSITNFNYVVTISSDSEGFKTQITITGQNNTGNTITLTEVGVCKPIFDVDQSSPSCFILLTQQQHISMTIKFK